MLLPSPYNFVKLAEKRKHTIIRKHTRKLKQRRAVHKAPSSLINPGWLGNTAAEAILVWFLWAPLVSRLQS